MATELVHGEDCCSFCPKSVDGFKCKALDEALESILECAAAAKSGRTVLLVVPLPPRNETPRSST